MGFVVQNEQPISKKPVNVYSEDVVTQLIGRQNPSGVWHVSDRQWEIVGIDGASSSSFYLTLQSNSRSKWRVKDRRIAVWKTSEGRWYWADDASTAYDTTGFELVSWVEPIQWERLTTYRTKRSIFDRHDDHKLTVLHVHNDGDAMVQYDDGSKAVLSKQARSQYDVFVEPDFS